MPCNSNHLEANQLEIEIGKLYELIDHVKKNKPISKDYPNGYDKRAYNKSNRKLADKLTAKLCKLCSKIKVKNYSLELQIWWRDHQEADLLKN